VVAGGLIIYWIARGRRNPTTESRTSSGIGAPSSLAPPMAPTGVGAGVPSSAPVPPAGGGVASGIVGGLVTGAAVGAGVVAGEALAHDLINGHGPGADQPKSNAPADSDLGGHDFGIADGGSWDDDGDGLSGGGEDDWN
jgi:uncharacterized protein